MNFKVNDMVKAGLFLALGIILPYAFHLTGLLGPVFLPMHIPVLLCGFILGESYGLIIGFITPLLNSVFTGMPVMYPIGIAMTFELAAYGFLAGYLYKRKGINIFISLIIAMFVGRFISGVMNFTLLTLGHNTFVLKGFLTASFVKGLWGIIIQILFIPAAVKALENTEMLARR